MSDDSIVSPVAPELKDAEAPTPKGGWLEDERVLEALLYVVTLVVTLVAMYWLLELFRADLHVLMRNWFDAYAVTNSVKSFIDHGSFVVNPSVGAPGGLNMLDYPGADGLNLLAVAVIGLLTRNAIVTVNLYYLATYPLVSLAAVYVLRRFSVSRSSAFLAGVLFAFMPYHYLRGTAHLFLSAYYLVPFVVLLALCVDSDRPPFFSAKGEAGASARFTPLTWASGGFALIALLVGMSGVYYAFFACFFFLVAGAYAALRHGSWKRLASAGIAIAITAATFVVQLLPTLWYHVQNGPNTLAVQRSPVEADAYGFRLSQLVLPSLSHRLAPLSQYFGAYWKVFFAKASFGLNESYYAALGIVGAIGFLALLVWPVFSRIQPVAQPSRFRDLMDGLSVLNMSGFLLGTAGGLGALFGLLTSQLRAYNRVSIFIAFLALFAVALMLDWLFGRIANQSVARITAVTVCCVVLLFGLFDQVVPSFLPDYEALAASSASDAQIVRALESSVPRDSMVFQLPYLAYPEGGTMPVWPYHMNDYQHFRAAIQSKTLRWSYGAMKGRPGDAWEQKVAGLPAPAMVAKLKADGFKAIWIDRTGYKDGGDAIGAAMEKATGSRPVMSPDGQVAVYLIR